MNPAELQETIELAVAHHRAGRLSEAEALYGRIINVRPDLAEIRVNLGVCLYAAARLDEAIDVFNQAIALDAGAASAWYNLAIIHLLQGDFSRGWQEHEWRWQVKGLSLPQHNFTQPAWDGSDLSGRRILLFAEQGIGDAIQFARYVPLVAKRGGRVVLGCHPELVNLFKSIVGVEQVFTEGDPVPQFDVYYPLLSLPLIFKTTLETIPSNIPYLRADPSKVRRWRKLLDESFGIKVGLVWAGRLTHADDRNRSLKLNDFADLARATNASFINLQKGPAAAQVNEAPLGLKLLDRTDELKDFSDTAALVECLDLVIAVDTAVAHLAGAMGKPVWVLLPFLPDWRWMLGRDDSPWYPTLRLFRQPAIGDWKKPIDEIVRSLQSFTINHR